MVEIKSTNYSIPLNLSSAVGHVKDLSFTHGWPTHFRDALIQSVAQIRSAHRWVIWAARCTEGIFSILLGNPLPYMNTGGEHFVSQSLRRDDPQLKQVSPPQRPMQPHGRSLFHHLLDGNLGCQASLHFPFSSKWLTHRVGNMTWTLRWDHCFFLITDTWRKVKWP